MSEKDEEFPIWLIWAITTRDQVVLREVCTSESRVRIATKICKEDKTVIRHRVEKSRANHHFGSSLRFLSLGATR